MKKTILYVLLLICSYSYAQTFPVNNIQVYYRFSSGDILSDDVGVTNLKQNGSVATKRFITK